MTAKEIGALLKEARRRANMTQDEVSRRVNVTSASISGYERGVNVPTTQMFLNLLACYGREVVIRKRGSDRSGWIPCTVSDPDQDGKYIVANHQWGEDSIGINRWKDGKWTKSTGVVAWMPLPMMYKGERA